MSHIQLERNHTMEKEQVRAMTEELGQKLKAKHGGDYCWEDDTVHYKHSGIDARVSFDDKTIRVDVKLGLLMGAFRGMIESEVTKYLDEKFA
ncbi:polyhydroxyalkanoic acid system family protein [Porticoccus sp.]|uniref:polyhydroxyalkanoic acid system family protein n=1 Tax=Porticoccus sp. TaxID=2024853 RepID=UPI003F6A0385